MSTRVQVLRPSSESKVKSPEERTGTGGKKHGQLHQTCTHDF